MIDKSTIWQGREIMVCKNEIKNLRYCVCVFVKTLTLPLASEKNYRVFLVILSDLLLFNIVG